MTGKNLGKVCALGVQMSNGDLKNGKISDARNVGLILIGISGIGGAMNVGGALNTTNKIKEDERMEDTGCEANRRGQIEEWLELNEKSGEELLVVIDRLENRLSSILHAQPPSGQATKEAESLVGVAERLRGIKSKISNGIVLINQIIERLEL